MLRVRIGGISFTVSFWFFAVTAAFFLVDRGVLLPYLIAPVVLHELGHLLVMALCRVRVRSVSFTALGVDIRRGGGVTLGYVREAAVCLGGVAANLLAAFLLHRLCFHSLRVMFLIAVNLAVAVFNLAPIGELDGGQLLKLLCARFLPPHTARTVSRVASVLVLGLLFGLVLFLLHIRQANLTLLVSCAYLAFSVLARE